MKAWKAFSPGPIPATLSQTTTPQPSESSLTNGQILVGVTRASLNPADYKIYEVGLASRFITSFPKTLGMDLSGRVVAVAGDVTDVKVGDNILARLAPQKSPGSLSEFVVLTHETYATLPADFDLDEAAGAPTAGLTAYQSIAPHVKAEDKVFINGGSGGVGLFGIQIAKALGCHVTVTCSTQKAEKCRALGADDIIDYKTSDVVQGLTQRGQVYSLCVDNVGDSPANLYASSHNFLQPDGKYVFVGGHVSASSAMSLGPSLLLPSFLGGGKRKFIGYLTANSRKDLESLRDLLVEGRVKTVVDSVFEFDQVPQAFEHLKKGLGGKIIVRVQEK